MLLFCDIEFKWENWPCYLLWIYSSNKSFNISFNCALEMIFFHSDCFYLPILSGCCCRGTSWLRLVKYFVCFNGLHVNSMTYLLELPSPIAWNKRHNCFLNDLFWLIRTWRFIIIIIILVYSVAFIIAYLYSFALKSEERLTYLWVAK